MPERHSEPQAKNLLFVSWEKTDAWRSLSWVHRRTQHDIRV